MALNFNHNLFSISSTDDLFQNYGSVLLPDEKILCFLLYVRDTKSYVRDTKSNVRDTKSYVRDTKSYV